MVRKIGAGMKLQKTPYPWTFIITIQVLASIPIGEFHFDSRYLQIKASRDPDSWNTCCIESAYGLHVRYLLELQPGSHSLYDGTLFVLLLHQHAFCLIDGEIVEIPRSLVKWHAFKFVILEWNCSMCNHLRLRVEIMIWIFFCNPCWGNCDPREPTKWKDKPTQIERVLIYQRLIPSSRATNGVANQPSNP